MVSALVVRPYAPRRHADAAAGSRLLDQHLGAIDRRQHLGGDDLRGRTDRAQAAVGDDGDAGRDHQRMVGIVGGQHDAEIVAREIADAREHQRLVAEVEARGRLVEHQDRRLLGERAGDQGKLALAAGNAGVVVRRELGDAEPGELFARDALVGRARAGERLDPRGAAHQHHVEHRERELGHVRLRHIGETPRDLGGPQLGERHAVDQHGAAERRLQPEQRAKQRGLAGAVRAEQAEDLARPQRQRDVAGDQMAAVADRKGARFEVHG